MYTFKGWNIEIKSETKLDVINDKGDNHYVVFDEDRDPVLWIRPSEYGDGLAIDKMGWGITFDVLHDAKKIIVTYTDPSLDDDE